MPETTSDENPEEPKLPLDVDLRSISDTEEALIVRLSSLGPDEVDYEVVFVNVAAYLVSSESWRVRTFERPDELPRLSAITTLESSWFLDWFHLESRGITEGRPITHFAIYADDDCIDVLGWSPPRVQRAKHHGT